MRGDGKVYEKKNGTWQAVIFIKGRRKDSTFAKKSAAQNWLVAMRKEKRRTEAGLPSGAVPARGVSVEEMAKELRDYWAAGTERVYTRSTLESYAIDLKAVVDRWGKRPVARIRASDIDLWVQEMRASGLSTSTVRHRLDRLSQVFGLAVRREYILAPPCQVRRPRLVQRSEPEAIPELEYRALREAASASDDPRRLAVLLLAGDAGLRREEMLRLRWEDLTLEELPGVSHWGVIHIAVRDEVDRPKSGRSRSVPILTERLRKALDALSWPGRSGPVLAGLKTVAGLQSLAERIWVDAAKRAREADRKAGAEVAETPIPERARLHGLRHRFGTWLAEQGVPTKTIRDWMGHSTILTTERYLRRRTGSIDAALLSRLDESARSGPR